MNKPTCPLIYRGKDETLWGDIVFCVLYSTDTVYHLKRDGHLRIFSNIPQQEVLRITFNINMGTWLSLSFQEALQYLEDHNVPTESFKKLECFSKQEESMPLKAGICISCQKNKQAPNSKICVDCQELATGTETISYPSHWPPRFYLSNDPCDVIQGMCCCGSVHTLEQDWVLRNLEDYGRHPNSHDVDARLKKQRDDNLRRAFGGDD